MNETVIKSSQKGKRGPDGVTAEFRKDFKTWHQYSSKSQKWKGKGSHQIYSIIQSQIDKPGKSTTHKKGKL